MAKVFVNFTSFNHAKYIRKSIDSVLNQTFTDFELIILDDASSDNSWELINQYSDPRIRAVRSVSQGEFAAWGNNAISEVPSDKYIAVHHSDDVWELDKLEKQVAFLDAHPEIGAVFTNAMAIREDSSPLTDKQHFYFSIFDQPNRTRHEWLRFFFSHGNALCHPSVLIRKACYDDCGLYRIGLVQLPDFDMWMRLCMKYEIHVLPDKLVRFRVLDNEANTSGSRPETRIRIEYEFYKVLQNYRLFKSFGDLVKVFPSAEKYYRNKGADLEFALAMVMLEEGTHAFAKLFALDILFDVISDPKRASNVKQLYDFDEYSFAAFTGQHDVFSQEGIADRNRQITSLNQTIAERDERWGKGFTDRTAEDDPRISGLKQLVRMRDRQLEDLEKIVQEKEQELTIQKSTLAVIVNSRGWKLLARYYRTRDIFFPVGSKRRKLLDSLMNK